MFPLFELGIGIAAHDTSIFSGKAYVKRMTEEEFSRLMRERKGEEDQPVKA